MLKLRLATKMSVVMSLLLAGIISLLALFAYFFLEKQFMATTSMQQYSMVKVIAEEIDSKIIMTQRQIVALSSTLDPNDFLDSERADRFLRMQPDELETFDSGISILSGSGKLLATYPAAKELIGRDYSYREHFKKTVSTGKPVISEPFLSTRRHQHPVITFTAPIFDGSGRLLGMLCGSLDLMKPNYLGKLAGSRLGEQGYLYLYNKQRSILVHPDQGRILKQDVPLGVNRLFDAAIRGFEGTGETVSSQGLPLISSFKRLNSTGWILAANYPQFEAYAPLRKAKWYFLAALTFTLCCTLLVTKLFMRHLTAPLNTFIWHVKEITGREQEPEPLQISTDDEIGVLANVFNQMVHEVHLQKDLARAQEVFSQNLLKNSSVATFALDGEHRIVAWNHACEELTGIQASEMLGTDSPWKAFYPNKRPVLADMVIDASLGDLSELYSSCIRSQFAAEGLHADGWYPALNGKARFICFDAAPIRDVKGKVIAAIETLRDITERKLAEESLIKLSLALEQMPVTVMITDQEGIVEYVNPNFTKVTGYEVDEVIGLNPRLSKSGWHTPEFFKELWDTILSGDTWRGELRNKKKNGDFYWESSSISPVIGPSGKIRHFVAVKEDITERKWAEEALRKSDEQIRLLLESTAEAIYGINLMGRCTFANPSCAKLLGYAHPDELIGNNMHQLVHHSQPDGTPFPVGACSINRVICGEGGVHVDNEFLWRSDGSHFAAEYWAYPQYSDGGLVGAVVTFFDITDMRQAEEKLQLALAAAEAAACAKSEFLANMSHEIRTPMNATVGMLYLLKQTELSGRQMNYLAKAQSASNLLLRVINDILDFSKIEAGKLVIESTTFHLERVFDDLVDMASAAIKSKAIELNVIRATDLPEYFIGDPLRLKQVLLNLTNNAIKFTEKGQVTVRVECTANDEEWVGLRFSVTDTGIGMAPEQLSNLFNAFAQADTSTTRKYGGSGLGLSISKQLVEMMGGSIAVESELEKGSTFSFTIKLHRASAEEIAAAAADLILSATVGHDTDAQNFNGVRILLVEDNTINQELAKELFERRGVEVDLAGNGADAVRIIAESGVRYHAVFMDVHMPVMDGLEATRRIRLLPEFATLPIIAMTASALPKERELSLAAGMNDQVNKPINVPELFSTLRRWVGPASVVDSLVLLGGPTDGETVLPEQLKGIDLHQAMRILESPVLLRKLLTGFRQENEGIIVVLRNALEEGDHELARRIVHTVKGVGGNLGAQGLCSAALVLEHTMGLKDEGSVREALGTFEDKLLQVLNSIRAMEEAEPKIFLEDHYVEECLVANDRIVEHFHKLAELLETDNLSALTAWEELRPLVSGAAAEKLESSMQCLDFRTASRILGDMVLSREVRLSGPAMLPSKNE